MKLQVFKAATMAAALLQVKSVLGHDAQILHTRTYSQRFWLGLRSKAVVEITAARSQPVRAGMPRGASGRAATAGDPRRALIDRPEVQSILVRDVLKELQSVKTMVQDVASSVRNQHSPNVPEEFAEYFRMLISNQVDDDLALDAIKSVQRSIRPEHLTNAEFVREKLAEQIEKLIPITGAIRRNKTSGPHVVALIGPTGVGKTTTIAKLAANLKVKEHRRVGLITIDTYRIAAVDQLRKYSDILGSSLRVVTSAGDLRESIQQMSDCEFVLVDTAGRSPNDTLKIGELRNFVRAGAVDEVHLVLSMTSSQASLELAAERFGDVQVDKIIFTKLDEAANKGLLLNLTRRINKPVSYITTGQDVPADIEVAQGRRIARLILGSEI